MHHISTLYGIANQLSRCIMFINLVPSWYMLDNYVRFWFLHSLLKSFPFHVLTNQPSATLPPILHSSFMMDVRFIGLRLHWWILTFTNSREHLAISKTVCQNDRSLHIISILNIFLFCVTWCAFCYILWLINLFVTAWLDWICG